MKPLIDADILLHELGWSGEFPDKESGETVLLDWDHVQKLLDEKITLICLEVEADEDPILFFSNSEALTKQVNRERRLFGESERQFVPNYRYALATGKPYKGTRKNPKPFHFDNILAYLRANFNHVIAEDGYEADDEMGIYQANNDRPDKETIICSRDKDLRIVPGNHYSWECGKQASIGPSFTDRFGRLERKPDGSTLGYGQLFFYYQLLCGDPADNIPGLPKCGDVAATKLLAGCETERDAFERVRAAYKAKSMSKEYFLEQANLLWIAQERGVGYEFPKK